MSNFDILVKANCIVCGKEFYHGASYKPNTCNSYECIHNFIHDREFYLKKRGGVLANIPALDNR